MTMTERIEGAVREMPDHWDESYDALIAVIERVVSAAVEEERAAILEIVDKQRREYESLAAMHASERGHTVAAIYAKDAKTCEHLAEAIRERGLIKPEPT